MNSLHDIALKHHADKAEPHDYCRIYEPLFEPLRDKPMTLLEIGIQFGNSANTFLEYFHQGEIYGVDVRQDFKSDNPHWHFFPGDIGDAAFWFAFAKIEFDIIIDDGPHVFETSDIAFRCLWPWVKSGGFYIIEDVFAWFDTHYQNMYGGVLPERMLFLVQWVAKLIGNLNQNGKTYFGKPSPSETPTGMETEIDFVHFHMGLVIIKKK